MREECKQPNILEYIEMMMDEGYSEDDAAKMWFCLYADSWDSDDDDGWSKWDCEPSRDDWDEEDEYVPYC